MEQYKQSPAHTGEVNRHGDRIGVDTDFYTVRITSLGNDPKLLVNGAVPLQELFPILNLLGQESNGLISPNEIQVIDNILHNDLKNRTHYILTHGGIIFNDGQLAYDQDNPEVAQAAQLISYQAFWAHKIIKQAIPYTHTAQVVPSKQTPQQYLSGETIQGRNKENINIPTGTQELWDTVCSVRPKGLRNEKVVIVPPNALERIYPQRIRSNKVELQGTMEIGDAVSSLSNHMLNHLRGEIPNSLLTTNSFCSHFLESTILQLLLEMDPDITVAHRGAKTPGWSIVS